MLSRVELKENAKASLKNVWGEAIKIILVLFLISFAAGFVYGMIAGILDIDTEGSTSKLITNLIQLVISGCLTFGMMSFFLKVSRNEEVTYKELFAKKDMFFKYVGASICIGIVVFVGTLLLVVPGIIAAFALSQTMYILLENPEMGIIDAMKKSNEMMKGHKMDYFVLILSFLGWAILGIFTIGILYLWLVPYIYVTEANFYNSLIDNN